MPSAICSSALVLLVAIAAAGCREAAPLTTPSIAVITLDTLRRDHVGVYHDRPSLTHYLDALAAEGLVHDAAYTTMPTTGPAHLSLFTGLHPSEHGSLRNGEPLSRDAAARDLGVRLCERGYATAAFVTASLANRRSTGLAGFEIYDAPRAGHRSGAEAVEAALAWLDAETRRPVFVWLHLYDAHAPYGDQDAKRRAGVVDPRLYGWVEPGRFSAPDARGEVRDRYAAGVRHVDAAVRDFVTGLRSRLDTRPFLVLVGDHGEALDEHLESRGYAFDHGEFLDPETIRIPLVVVGPGVVPGRSAGAASIRDLYTTVIAVADLEDAAPAGRRDLRTPSDAARSVEIERRRFLTRQPDLVARHAAAASDGARLVIVAEDGTPTRGDPARDGDLLDVARRRAAAATRAREARPLDPETRDALRALGYVE